MKFVLCLVLSCLLLCSLAFCEEDKGESVQQIDDPKDKPTEAEEASSSPKTKRGIFHHPGYATHALTYNVPLGTAVHPHYGFQKPWNQITYAKSPFGFSPNFLSAPPPSVHHHALHHHPIVHTAPAPLPAARPHLLITPGGASVTSYNVNYPRYAFYAKPQYHFDIPTSSAPRPTVFVQQQPKPIIPVAVPAFSNRIPILSRPSYHHVVQTLPAAPSPVYPVPAGVPHFHGPQFIPVQPTIATIPTTFSTIPTFTTTGAPVLPSAAGTHHHHFGGVAPPVADQWRPIFVSPPAPTQNAFGTAAAARPAIGLLPPLGSAPAGAGAAATSDQHALFHQQQQQQQIELQQQFESADFGEQHQQQVSQVYGPPADDQTHQDFIQGNQQLLHAQLLEQQQQQRAIVQEQQQIHAGGPFNGQGYEPPSNNGHYGGPSSYDVQLNSYIQA